MTGRNGYFNPRSEEMKDAAKRYVSTESDGLIQRIGDRIGIISTSNKWDARVERELRESIGNTLYSRASKFIEAFSSLVYDEFGKTPTKEVKKSAGEYILRYTQLLRDYQNKAEVAEGSLKIRGSSMQFRIEADALASEMLQSLKEINRK